VGNDFVEVNIGADGRVLVRQTGQANLNEVGQIQLARFVNPQGLKQIGGTLYIESDASGPPVTGQPQQDGIGSIRQSGLEMSNVDPVRELISLITTQRAFELNSQSVRAAEESLQVVTNLRR